jgi:hypothetical protein
MKRLAFLTCIALLGLVFVAPLHPAETPSGTATVTFVVS